MQTPETAPRRSATRNFPAISQPRTHTTHSDVFALHTLLYITDFARFPCNNPPQRFLSRNQ